VACPFFHIELLINNNKNYLPFRSSFALSTKDLQRSSILVPSIPTKEKNRLSLVVYLSLVTGEFIAYRNNEYGSDDDEDDDDDSINSFIFTILFVKPIKKK
jgi:hypothetical protein